MSHVILGRRSLDLRWHQCPHAGRQLCAEPTADLFRRADPLVNLSTRSQVAAKEGGSTRAAALKVLREDGIAGLYDGLSSSLRK